MYVLTKTTGEYSDTFFEVVACSKSRKIINDKKKKLELEYKKLVDLAKHFNKYDHFMVKFPDKSRPRDGSPEHEQIKKDYIAYNKELVKSKPEYLPYLSSDGDIWFYIENITYAIENVEELFS